PVGTDRRPAVTQPFDVGVTVLRDDRAYAFRVPCRQPDAGRRTVVEYIDRKASKADNLREAVDDARDNVERVGELAAIRHVGLAKAEQVGCDHVKVFRQPWD